MWEPSSAPSKLRAMRRKSAVFIEPNKNLKSQSSQRKASKGRRERKGQPLPAGARDTLQCFGTAVVSQFERCARYQHHGAHDQCSRKGYQPVRHGHIGVAAVQFGAGQQAGDPQKKTHRKRETRHYQCYQYYAHRNQIPAGAALSR